MTVVFTIEPFLVELTEFVFRHRLEREVVMIPSSVSHASNDIRKIDSIRPRGIAVIGG